MSSSHAILPAGGIGAEARPEATAAAPRRYLFGPVIDFVCLGGSSLIYLPLLFLRPAEDYRASLALGMLLLANAINHPHFAHSYQIFYRDFRRKVAGDGYGPALRRGYIGAGIVAPLLLAAFLLGCVLLGSVRTLGYAGNLMAFVVGWHYVKQGYGMLMVDAALKRLFFSDQDKKILLANSYAVWALSWLLINVMFAERELWGVPYFALPVPTTLLVAAIGAALVTSALAARMLWQRWEAHGRRLPLNGVVAYGASLYAWLLLVRVDPLWFLVVPVLHSLQYLVVVWRFESNRQKGLAAAAAPTASGRGHRSGVALFVAAGAVLGFAGFWGVPILLDATVPYDRSVFGNALFLFVFWIFINVHHYFMDSVMWRRENPDTRRYLFG